MIKILDRYLLLRFLTTFMISLIVISGVIFIFDFVELLRVSSAKSISLNTLMLLCLSKAPIHIQKILPILILLSTLIVFIKLNKNSELTILKACGVSIWRIVSPVLVLVFMIGIINIFALNPIIARLTAHYYKMESTYLKGSSSLLAVSKTGLWIKQISKNNAQSIIHALRIDPNNLTLYDVCFYFVNDGGGFLYRVDADYARLDGDHWMMPKASLSSIHELNSVKENFLLETNLTAAQINDSLIRPEAISFFNLIHFISLAEDSGLSMLKHKLFLYKTLFSSLIFMASVIFAISFCLASNRKSAQLVELITCLMLSFFLYILSDFVNAFALSGRLDILLSVLVIPIIQASVGVYRILKIEEVAV